MGDLLEYRGFHGTIEYSKDDECLIGQVQFIEGTIVYAGENISEIKEMFLSSVDEYLTMCEEKNIEPLKPFKGSFNVRIPPLLHKQSAVAAKNEGKTLNSYVQCALEEKVSGPKVQLHHHFHDTADIAFESVINESQYALKSDAPQYVSAGVICH